MPKIKTGKIGKIGIMMSTNIHRKELARKLIEYL